MVSKREQHVHVARAGSERSIISQRQKLFQLAVVHRVAASVKQRQIATGAMDGIRPTYSGEVGLCKFPYIR